MPAMPISTQLTASLGAPHVTLPYSTPRTGPSEQRQDICHPLHASPAPRPTAHTRQQGPLTACPAAASTSPTASPRKEPQAAKKLQLTQASGAGNRSAQRQQPVKCCHLPVSTASSLGKQSRPRRFHLNNWTVTAAGLYCSSMCLLGRGIRGVPQRLAVGR